jgi:hypothetical protein
MTQKYKTATDHKETARIYTDLLGWLIGYSIFHILQMLDCKWKIRRVARVYLQFLKIRVDPCSLRVIRGGCWCCFRR